VSAFVIPLPSSGIRHYDSRMRPLPLLASILLLPAILLAEREYPLKIFRPDAAGMRFKVTIVIGSRYEVTRTVRNQVIPPNETIQATQLDATAEILEVTDKGHDLKIKYVVERFVKVLENGEAALLPPGRTFTAELKGKETVYTLDEGELTDDLKHHLDIVAHIGEPDNATPDELYLPKAPQQIGATWKPDGAALAKEYQRGGWRFSADDVEGTVKLAGLDKLNNKEALNLAVEWKVEKADFTPPKDGRMGAMKVASAGPLEVKYNCMIPTDPATMDVTASGSSKSTLVFKSPDDDNPATVQVKSYRAWEVHATLIGRK
jgi:hypothetical protein